MFIPLGATLCKVSSIKKCTATVCYTHHRSVITTLPNHSHLKPSAAARDHVLTWKYAGTIGSHVVWRSTYRPKDEYRARKTGNTKWDYQKSRKYIKIGSVVVTVLSLATTGLVYKVVNDFHEQLSFFPHIFELERGFDSYIPVDVQDDEDEPEAVTWIKNKLIVFPWLQSHSHDLWTLLKLAQSERRSIRHMGVQSIAEQTKWADAQYRMMAQALDKRTLVGLARTRGADNRLFLPPPRLPSPQTGSAMDDVEHCLRELLIMLPTENLDKCTKYFTSTALREGSKAAAQERDHLSTMWSEEGGDFFKAKADTTESRVERLFLLALHGHSELESHCPMIVQLGGLKLLRQINDLRMNNMKITRQIARILANLALYKALHNDIINAGWVTILARWMQSGDFALTLHATKTLANLDRDYGEKRLYPDGVYLYYPQFRYREPIYADVVFVHGLLGGPFRTWRQSDRMRPRKGDSTSQLPEAMDNPQTSPSGVRTEPKPPPGVSTEPIPPPASARQEGGGNTEPYTNCWPKDWLSKDIPHVRIITVEYETHLSEWAPRCPYESEKRTLAMRSDDLLRKLKMAGIGDRPIVWVGHSMGGLLIKQMLLNARQDPTFKHIVDRSKGIVLYSVPHRGSPLAAYSNHASSKFLLYPSVEVKELHQGATQLLKLHKDFRELMFDVGIPLLSFAEGQKTELPLNVKVMIVPPESSDPGFGDVHVLEESNHLNICKPLSKASPVYQLTAQFIRDCIPPPVVGHILRANIRDDYIFPEDLGEKQRQ